MRGRVLVGLAMALAAGVFVTAPLSAQGRRGRGGARGGGFTRDEPKWWGSVWGGYQWSNPVGDPATSSVWDYDANWALRFAAERTVAPNTTIGVAYSYSRLPLTIRGSTTASECRIPCSADGTIASYGLMLHSGGGPGLHLVYEGFLGAMQFSNFTVAGDGATRYATLKNTDLAWMLSPGIGYSLSRDFQLLMMLDVGNSVHEKASDLFQRRTTRHYTTRVGVRVGL